MVEEASAQQWDFSAEDDDKHATKAEATKDEVSTRRVGLGSANAAKSELAIQLRVATRFIC